MKNAVSRIGWTCVSTMLLAGALFAGNVNPVTVTLPHAVTVGSITLPVGEYTLSNIDMNDGSQYVVVRAEHGAAVTLPVQRINAAKDAGKTEVTLQKDGDGWHFEKMFIRGDHTGYQFVDQK